MIDPDFKIGRYLAFGYFNQYPEGGLDDCMGSSDDLDEIFEFIKSWEYDQWMVWDTVSREEVFPPS